MMNAGIQLIASLTPGISAIIILGMLIFAAGFVMTLVSTLKVQWGHKSGEAEHIISGVLMIVIGFILIGGFQCF